MALGTSGRAPPKSGAPGVVSAVDCESRRPSRAVRVGRGSAPIRRPPRSPSRPRRVLRLVASRPRRDASCRSPHRIIFTTVGGAFDPMAALLRRCVPRLAPREHVVAEAGSARSMSSSNARRCHRPRSSPPLIPCPRARHRWRVGRRKSSGGQPSDAQNIRSVLRAAIVHPAGRSRRGARCHRSAIAGACGLVGADSSFARPADRLQREPPPASYLGGTWLAKSSGPCSTSRKRSVAESGVPPFFRPSLVRPKTGSRRSAALHPRCPEGQLPKREKPGCVSPGLPRPTMTVRLHRPAIKHFF